MKLIEKNFDCENIQSNIVRDIMDELTFQFRKFNGEAHQNSQNQMKIKEL